ncbi:MAG: hypothetical protein QNK22_06405 [Xanthomonadales bacterium]|nr:hypothetical protein [Xanthomonadales bacterium]
MVRAFKILLTGALLLVSLPVPAQVAVDEKTLVLPLSSEMATNGMAKVVTSMGRPADCLAPLAVSTIDGEKRAVPARGFLIEPGVHTVNGRATLDLATCPLSESNLSISSAADLEVEFQPGTTYYLGYHHQSANPEQWKLVVWHIEEVLGSDISTR